MGRLKVVISLILILTISITSMHAYASGLDQKQMENKTITNQSISQSSLQPISVQEQLMSLHFKIGYLSLDLSKKQIAEYLIIAAIPLIIILVIASTVRSKNKKQIRK